MPQTVTPYLLYEDVEAAAEFLTRAFAFREVDRARSSSTRPSVTGATPAMTHRAMSGRSRRWSRNSTDRVSSFSLRQDRHRMVFARIVYRCCYVIGVASGTAAARLAADFRALGATRAGLVPLAVVLQLTVLACWLIVRPISLTAFTACFALAPRLQAEA